MMETVAKMIEATEEADGHVDNDGDGQPIIMPGAHGSQSSLIEGFWLFWRRIRLAMLIQKMLL